MANPHRPAMPTSVRRIPFARGKYGRELLVDVGAIEDLPGFITDPQPHRLDFHDILLVTAGRGRFWLDDQAYRVEPGVVLFTAPGQIRSWEVTGLDGICLFFTSEFLTSFFSDPLFLDRFAFFGPPPDQPLRLTPSDRRDLLRPLAAMRREVRRLRRDSDHLLRALVYEVLSLLDRAWIGAGLRPTGRPPTIRMVRFKSLVEERFRREHRLRFYAGALHLTPGYLNELVVAHFGCSAGDYLRARRVLEAKRALAFSGMTVQRIATALGFADPSYFCRFFRRETGLRPLDYRRQHHRSA
ncbi:MAG: AraC family transcriptional regulator [Gemmatimonadales bacterium]